MKASNVNFQGYKMFVCRSRDIFSHQVGKIFLMLVILCAGCTPSAKMDTLLPVTGIEEKAAISFSPEVINFGTLSMGNTSSAKKVTIHNDGSDPLVISQLSVTAGFSIVASTCPKTPEAIASQGTCTVEIVFKPNLPRSWVGELQIDYNPELVVTMPLKGFAQPKINLFAWVLP